MKKILFILLMCLPIISMAKDKKDNSNPKYLTGAVTTIDGRVAFMLLDYQKQTFSIKC